MKTLINPMSSVSLVVALFAFSATGCGLKKEKDAVAANNGQQQGGQAGPELAGTSWKSSCHGAQDWSKSGAQSYVTEIRFSAEKSRLTKNFYSYTDTECKDLYLVDEVSGAFLIGKSNLPGVGTVIERWVQVASTPKTQAAVDQNKVDYKDIDWKLDVRAEIPTATKPEDLEAGRDGGYTNLYTIKDGKLQFGKYGLDVLVTAIDASTTYSKQ